MHRLHSKRKAKFILLQLHEFKKRVCTRAATSVSLQPFAEVFFEVWRLLKIINAICLIAVIKIIKFILGVRIIGNSRFIWITSVTRFPSFTRFLGSCERNQQ